MVKFLVAAEGSFAPRSTAIMKGNFDDGKV